MSRSYDVNIQVSKVPNVFSEVQKAERLVHELTGIEPDSYASGPLAAVESVSVEGSGNYTLCGGATPDETSEEWAKQILLLGDYQVDIHWWFAERDPDESFTFEREE